MNEFEADLAALTAWLPLALAAGSLGYAVYLALSGRAGARDSAGASNAPEHLVGWPSETDRRYFESELQLATSFLEFARSTRVRADALECVARAAAIRSDLSSWMRVHGGDATFERSLDRLGWLIDAGVDGPARDF